MIAVANVENSLVKELELQAIKPPGQDQVIGSFYKAVLESINSNQLLGKLVTGVSQERQMSPQLFVNLLFRAFQFYLTENYRQKDYPIGLDSESQWSPLLENVLSDRDQFKTIEDLLLTEHTTTTIYERYASSVAIAVALYNHSNVSWVDLGCGGGFGSLGAVQGEPFGQIVDDTSNKYFTNQINEFNNGQFRIGTAIGIDLYDPRLEKTKRWRRACQFYPKEWGQREQRIAVEEKLLDADKVTFAIGDFTTGRNQYSDGQGGAVVIPKGSQNIVVLNTVLYMHQSLSQQENILDYAHSLIKPDGVIVLSEFANKAAGEDVLNFTGVEWGTPFNYRTFIIGDITNNKIWEIFQWDSGRCKVVKNGEDFEKFLLKTHRRAV